MWTETVRSRKGMLGRSRGPELQPCVVAGHVNDGRGEVSGRVSDLVSNDSSGALQCTRFVIEDTPLTKKGKTYEAIVALDKLCPWLSFGSAYDDMSSTDEDDEVQCNE
ncbi:hypothetical protein B5X24_HaOG212461 [Helicoverpa armigera]|nr:hypothetical protein B5X24_HaOG212461 [Helicoverpa armigera]